MGAPPGIDRRESDLAAFGRYNKAAVPTVATSSSTITEGGGRVPKFEM